MDSTDETLRIYGNLSLLEMAPVLLAANGLYPGRAQLAHGGVMALWGEASDLASLSSAGEADLAANSETQALRGAAAHPDLRFIFTLAECPYRLVARRSAGIARLGDLRGKRIATQLESSAEYFLQALLGSAGVAPQEVTRVPFMAHTDAPISLTPQALKEGRVDAVALWEPQAERARAAVGEDAIVFRDAGVYTEKFNLCARRASLEDPVLRRRIVAFVRALIAAVRDLREDPARAQQLVAREAELDIGTVRGAWPCLRYPGKLAGDLLETFARQEPWIAGLQRRPARTRAALAALIDDSVWREAREA